MAHDSPCLRHHVWQAELQKDFEESSAPRASMFFADFVRFQAKHVRRWIAQHSPDSGAPLNDKFWTLFVTLEMRCYASQSLCCRDNPYLRR
jgi:hypothetical protein